jgi:hypothetical protein
MKRILFPLLFIVCSLNVTYAEKANYFFDKSIVFDSKIPSPEQFFGYETGDRITEHHKIVSYFEKLAELSDRASLVEIGRTHEKRPIKILIVSSPENIRNLENIQKERENVRKGQKVNTPLIVFLGYTVHGNEPSGAEAAILSAYYLVAAQNDFVQKELADGIYFVDPVRNPDGQERFAEWVSLNASVNYRNVSAFDREHTEAWPGGRGNHYWFDLNRDWINIVNPESQARVKFYQSWLPHVQADHHEMGTNSTFFFEPTDPDGNESRFVPQSTYKLNRDFAEYYSAALDKIGSFYYTKEGYDNKNPNFGSTYPDYNGGVGILFEQGSSRGIHQASENGIVTFAHTLRNQLVAAIATVDAANGHRDALFDLQKEFFTENGKSDKSSFIIGDSYDRSRLNKFVKLLLAHHLEVYANDRDVTLNGITYEKGKSYIIPVAQANSALIQIIFDDKKDYKDITKLGYGAGFSVAYSTGLAHAKALNLSRGSRVETVDEAINTPFQQSNYAYLVDYRNSKSQQLLFRLLEKNILVKSAFKPFSIKTAEGVRDFSYGTLLVPVSIQSIASDQLFVLLKELREQEQVDIIPVTSGYNVKGVDLGSSTFRTLSQPKVLVISGGSGISSTEVGEVWHLFDIKLKYPVVRVEYTNFSRVPLNQFNRIVFVNGTYSFLTPADIQSLKTWIGSGNTLITFNGASQWAASGNLIEKSGGSRDSTKVETDLAAAFRNRLPTSIFETKINLESPIAFGLTSEILPVTRESRPSLPATGTVVASYTDKPLLNGYLADDQVDSFKNKASIRINPIGLGNVVLFAEDPLFRGTWDATERTFVNAVLFGDILRSTGYR